VFFWYIISTTSILLFLFYEISKGISTNVSIQVSMPYKYERQIIQVGNSNCVVLPKPWLDYYEASTGDRVEMITRGRTCTIMIVPNNKNKDFDESDK